MKAKFKRCKICGKKAEFTLLGKPICKKHYEVYV